MEILFIDVNESFINEINRLFEGNDCVRGNCCNMKEIKVENTAFLFPCDIFLNMDTNLGKVYNCELFPHIQLAAKIQLKELGIKSLLGRDVLPIGSALLVPADPDINAYMIYAPTMIMKQNVYRTINAYISFIASLCLLQKYDNPGIKTLVCPGLCTGSRSGKMDPKISAYQIFNAYLDFMHDENIPLQHPEYDIKSNAYITHFLQEEQPDLFENLEIKIIDAAKVQYNQL